MSTLSVKVLVRSWIAECVAAMQRAVDVPVTETCRDGIDDQNLDVVLADAQERIREAGADPGGGSCAEIVAEGTEPEGES